MRLTDKVNKKSALTITKALKINIEIEEDIAKFEKEFPKVDMNKLWRSSLYLGMKAIRDEN